MVLLTSKEHPVLPQVNRRKPMLAFTTAVLLFLLLITLLVTDPILIATKWGARLTHGSGFHEFLMEKTEAAHVSVYIFNITNGEAFLSGQDYKLKVEEIGPFTYREIRTNKDIELDEEAGILRYSPHLDVVFLPEESIGRPDDVKVNVINIPMLGIASMLSSLPYLTKLAVGTLLQTDKPIKMMTAEDLIWGGDDRLVKLANTLLPGIYKTKKFGVLEKYYNLGVQYRMEVSARDEDKFVIKKRDGKTKLMMADYIDVDQCEKCNTFENSYEGLGYPSGITPETPIRLFRNGVCKIFDTDFSEIKILENNVEGLFFNLSDRFYSWGENDTSGLLDLSTCYYGFPVYLSKSHFLDMDPKIYERIEGMKPNPAEHGSYIVLEPKIAMQMDTYVTMQTNMVFKDLRHVSSASNFSNMIVPLTYIKLVQPELLEKTKLILRDIYVVYPYVLLGFKIMLLTIIFVLFAYCARVYYADYWGPKQDNLEKTVLEAEENLLSKKCDQIKL